MTLLGLLAVAAVGTTSGLLIGCVGIGGVIVVPCLTYLGDVPIRTAIASAMLGYVLTGAVGTFVYARKRSIRWGMAAALCAGAAPAALVGALFSNVAPGAVLELAIGLLTAGSGLYSLFGPAPEAVERTLPRPRLAVIGAMTGFASAITGTGGPLVLVPLLMWFNLPVLTAIGLSQAIQLPISVLASVGNLAYGAPEILLSITLAVTLTVGTWAGARLAHALAREALQRIVSIVLVVVGGLIVAKIVHRVVA
jgi:uncharacterized membrane protein YfcA